MQKITPKIDLYQDLNNCSKTFYNLLFTTDLPEKQWKYLIVLAYPILETDFNSIKLDKLRSMMDNFEKHPHELHYGILMLSLM